MHEEDDVAYLNLVAARVRALRAQRAMTRRILARDSGISERYLAQLESGTGNPTISVVRALARAFDVPPDSLIAEETMSPLADSLIGAIRAMSDDQLLTVHRLLKNTLAQGDDAARRERVALIGLRGAGKSTLGTALANALGVPFIELDKEIEREASAPLAEIMEFYGQAGFRRFERNSLERVLEREARFVLATGGGIVSEPLTYERLLATCYTIWLRAEPHEHMERVIAQGDMRPMAGNREAMADLRRILEGREALYSRADVTVDTSNRTIEDTTAELLRDVRAIG
jgi:XRE family transcriptional regulator, aerobic/anaerobic benzoate catabolism transcriptional regulator